MDIHILSLSIASSFFVLGIKENFWLVSITSCLFLWDRIGGYPYQEKWIQK